MWDRVAKTKTEKTAWKLLDLFAKALPWVSFVIVIRAPGAGYEIVPITAFHPLDREVTQRIVEEFKQKKLIND